MFCIRVFNKILILLIAISLSWYSSSHAASNIDNKIIRLATTTSTENSGLLRYLLPQFTEQTGYTVHVIAVGTGKALRMGQDGDVDLVLVHAPAAEAKFINEKFGVKRFQVMYNDFVILGPDNDPATIKKASSATDALKRIASTNAKFVSRGDDSGTHKKELSLWQASKTLPVGQWYREAGQGMGKVIQIASEMNAYTIADRGTWLAYKDKSSLHILYQGDSVLHNPYGIIAVNPERYPDLNVAGAKVLIKWLTSRTGQALIGDFSIAGFRLFTPAANSTGAVTHLNKQSSKAP